MLYKQCKMEKTEKNSLSVQTAWIPAEFAKIGHYVELRVNDTWDNGWKVVEVGSVSSEWKEVNERSRDHLRQREASDI